MQQRYQNFGPGGDGSGCPSDLEGRMDTRGDVGLWSVLWEHEGWSTKGCLLSMQLYNALLGLGSLRLE